MVGFEVDIEVEVVGVEEVEVVDVGEVVLVVIIEAGVDICFPIFILRFIQEEE